jgi:transposase
LKRERGEGEQVAAFREGDDVVVSEGGGEGTRGVFLTLDADTNWAVIAERDGHVRRYPVAWLMSSPLHAAKARQRARLATRACRHGRRKASSATPFPQPS